MSNKSKIASLKWSRESLITNRIWWKINLMEQINLNQMINKFKIMTIKVLSIANLKRKMRLKSSLKISHPFKPFKMLSLTNKMLELKLCKLNNSLMTKIKFRILRILDRFWTINKKKLSNQMLSRLMIKHNNKTKDSPQEHKMKETKIYHKSNSNWINLSISIN